MKRWVVALLSCALGFVIRIDREASSGWSIRAVGMARAEITVTKARIGCLDIQTDGNITSIVGQACNGKKTCSYKAPSEDEYKRAGVHAKTRTFCTQAMEIIYSCGDGRSDTVLVPGDAWNHPPALLECKVRDFDVVTAGGVDANRFPLNPKWGQQARDNTVPNPRASCPLDDTNSLHWVGSPNCTSFPVTFNGASGFICGHHINFLPVTYDGNVRWDSGPSVVGDLDYSFNVTRPDAALYSTAGAQVHIEFDVRETIYNWDDTGTWWADFHTEQRKGDQQAHNKIDDHYVIVVGLLGMDSYHDGKTELHPVYAMFVLTNRDARSKQSSWAFFVRNWGNEGICDGDQEDLNYQQPIRIQIPRTSEVFTKMQLASNNPIWQGARNTNDLSGMRFSAQPNSGGILLSFTLLAPEKQSYFMGDLTFEETASVGPANASAESMPVALRAHLSRLPRRTPAETFSTVSAKEEHEEGLHPALRAHLERLPQSDINKLLEKQLNVVPASKATRVKAKVIAEPAGHGELHLEHVGTVARETDLVRPRKDPEGELVRRKQAELLKAFLAERGIHVETEWFAK
jgi:hypothetical protein